MEENKLAKALDIKHDSIGIIRNTNEEERRLLKNIEEYIVSKIKILIQKSGREPMFKLDPKNELTYFFWNHLLRLLLIKIKFKFPFISKPFGEDDIQNYYKLYSFEKLGIIEDLNFVYFLKKRSESYNISYIFLNIGKKNFTKIVFDNTSILKFEISNITSFKYFYEQIIDYFETEDKIIEDKSEKLEKMIKIFSELS